MENRLNNSPSLKLYRRRFIPDECIPLPDDVILRYENGLLVTAWKTIRPKKELSHGYSCYYLNEGYKVSKFYRADHTLLYYYCDIISPDYEENTNTLTVTDLLLDAVVYPDGFVKVTDLDELVCAQNKGMLTLDQFKEALLILDRLLKRIYAGEMNVLLAPINSFDPA